LQKGFQFSPPDQAYTDFANSFKFQETQDQQSAIDDVISDMTSTKPMDRLVCGDVGFGKTEIAMRAAFKTLCDNKQVAVLVPTTVLSFQHYNSFTERFKDVAVNIEFISRFKTTKQVNEILCKLDQGKIDILIGTHKILSEKVKFKDLGLLVVDEEQRFGVAHKEKMKLIRENVDTLTLTATPIPRTLQMSFLGIKDLSIIKTAPARRQTIKSYIIKDDQHTIKLAIEKELSRSGQIFIVHNRVSDIEIYANKIQLLIPKARVIFAHGQMGEKDLEKRITDFYQYKYDILISTTIIESGIDIPRANTMIIDRADTFGLSQLHQLRGRIGRSDKKAYAYFIIPSFHNISEVANKRLKALQTYAELGSGFNLASSDLEIRGSGDILGAEQSGHIGNIGLELYMELLQDAINEIKGKPASRNRNIEFNTPFNGFIPKEYMSDAGSRLKFYKKLSNSSSKEDIDALIDEIVDKYGKLPEQILNLEKILHSRVNLQDLAINSVKTKASSIVLSFDTDILASEPELRDKILGFFMERPKIYKINPDYSINCIFKDKIDINTLVDFTEFLQNRLNN
jgi:transcription-repair coupling factor (superfamily II helicase)